MKGKGGAKGKGGRRRRPARWTGAFAVAAVAAASLGACSSTATEPGQDGGLPAPFSVPTPLATSLRAAGGTWATVPMGHLGQPSNTFWQLFFRPQGARDWSDKVQATATATNGGLVLAPLGRGLLVGVRPSADLTFTPLISSPDAGRSWSDGLIDAALVPRPGSLAGDGAGGALALVDQRGGLDALSTTGDLSKWQPLVSRAALAAGPAGRSCGLGALTATGYLSGHALLGASCSRPGVLGMFTKSGGYWRLAGPSLAGPSRHGDTEVLDIATGPGATSVLFAVEQEHRSSLYVARPAAGGRWAATEGLFLDPYQEVASFGQDQGGFFVLTRELSGQDKLFAASEPEGSWEALPSPPPGTTTVAFGGPGAPQALVAGSTTLTVWSLVPISAGSGPSRWVRQQILHVPIQFGSSS